MISRVFVRHVRMHGCTCIYSAAVLSNLWPEFEALYLSTRGRIRILNSSHNFKKGVVSEATAPPRLRGCAASHERVEPMQL